MHIHFDFWPTLSFLLVMFSWFLFAIVFVLQKRPPSPPDKERDPGSLMGAMLQGVSYAVVWAWHRHPLEPIVSMNNAAKILFVIVTAIRVRSEERLLHETFSARFDDYRQRGPAVVPFVF